MSLHRPGRIWIPEAPHLVLARTLEAEVEAPMIGWAGIIRARAYKPGVGFVREATTRNLITNAALNAIGNASGALDMTWAAVGTGTAEPTAGDTSLQNQGPARTNTAATGDSTAGVGSTSDPRWHWHRRARRWAVGAATGTWTEAGFFSASTGGTMFNRALFRDQNGVPTPFTVLADEELWLDLFVRKYVPGNDVTGQFTITGSGTHDYTIRAQLATSGTMWGALVQPIGGNQGAWCEEANTLVDITAGFVGSAGGTSWAAYGANNFYRDITAVFDPGAANFATGIGRFAIIANPGALNAPTFQMALTQKIQKTAVHRLTITFRQPFGRYTGTL